MPTMNGWLLGYPVVYQLQDAQAAERASRALSSSTLLLHRVRLRCALQLAQQPPVRGQGDALCAFSVPDELLACQEVLGGVARWFDALRAAAGRAAGVWGAPELVRASVGPGPVAL
jgi:hypothetical protein